MKTRKRFQIQSGNVNTNETVTRTIEITGTGKNTYIWIGGEGCYGHMSGVETLRCLANSILESLPKKKV